MGPGTVAPPHICHHRGSGHGAESWARKYTCSNFTLFRKGSAVTLSRQTPRLSLAVLKEPLINGCSEYSSSIRRVNSRSLALPRPYRSPVQIPHFSLTVFLWIAMIKEHTFPTLGSSHHSNMIHFFCGGESLPRVPLFGVHKCKKKGTFLVLLIG